MWCWHQPQQMGIPTMPDHLAAFEEAPEKISAGQKLGRKQTLTCISHWKENKKAQMNKNDGKTVDRMLDL